MKKNGFNFIIIVILVAVTVVVFLNNNVLFAPSDPVVLTCGDYKEEEIKISKGAKSWATGADPDLFNAISEAEENCLAVLISDDSHRKHDADPEGKAWFTCDPARQQCINGGGQQQDCSLYLETPDLPSRDPKIKSSFKIISRPSGDGDNYVVRCDCELTEEFEVKIKWGCTDCPVNKEALASTPAI